MALRTFSCALLFAIICHVNNNAAAAEPNLLLGNQNAPWWVFPTGPSYWSGNNNLSNISDLGSAAIIGASRASDKYGSVPVWTPGTSISAGTQRGANSAIWQAATTGTTGANRPPSTGTTFNDGGVTWNFVSLTTSRSTGALVGFTDADVNDGQGAWVGYFEGAANSGTTVYGAEIAIKNLGPDQNPTPYNGVFGPIGIWLAGGADSSDGAPVPTAPSAAAIMIGKNASTWDKGIVFRKDGLTGNDGVTPGQTATAIEMPSGDRLVWKSPSDAVGAAIWGDSATLGVAPSYEMADFTHRFYIGSHIVTQIEGAGSVADYFRFTGAATGAPLTVAVGGQDTNVDIEIVPAGAGVVRTPNSFRASGIGGVGAMTLAALKALDPTPSEGDTAIVTDANLACNYNSVPNGGGNAHCRVTFIVGEWVEQ